MVALATRVVETANNPGTGTFNLAGSAPSFRSWAQGFTSGAQVYYFADDGTQAEWGIGVYTGGTPATVTRATVLGNSAGSTARLNFTGAVFVYSDLPAERLPDNSTTPKQGGGNVNEVTWPGNTTPVTIVSQNYVATATTLRCDLKAALFFEGSDNPPAGSLMTVRLDTAISVADANGNGTSNALAKSFDVAAIVQPASGKLTVQTTATGLTPGTTYNFTVTATMQAGSYRGRLSFITLQWLMV